ncbi:MAG TPA: hypothetical protein IAC31_02410 [Candidatus Faecousia intestinigallinarum]|nr:hypothetical protein [Candidatus Faecousia intestinigallinarum]
MTTASVTAAAVVATGVSLVMVLMVASMNTGIKAQLPCRQRFQRRIHAADTGCRGAEYGRIGAPCFCLNISIPAFAYVAYTAVQILSEDKCLQIISCDEDQMEDVQESLPSMGKDKALRYLHESVESVKPYPQCDYYEIGYPAKFSKFCELPNCIPLGIVRHGIFSRNIVLTDHTIYAELRGEDGSTGQKFKTTVDMRNLSFNGVLYLEHAAVNIDLHKIRLYRIFCSYDLRNPLE